MVGPAIKPKFSKSVALLISRVVQANAFVNFRQATDINLYNAPHDVTMIYLIRSGMAYDGRIRSIYLNAGHNRNKL